MIIVEGKFCACAYKIWDALNVWTKEATIIFLKKQKGNKCARLS